MLMFKEYNPSYFPAVVEVFRNARTGDDYGNGSPEVLAQHHLNKSIEATVVFLDGKPIAVFGVTDKYTIMSGYKYQAWFIGTDEVTMLKKSFVEHGREVVNKWVSKYKRVFFLVWWKFEKSVKMAKALKFSLKANLGEIGVFVKER